MSEVPPEIVEVGAVATLEPERQESDTEEFDGAASEGGTDEEPEEEFVVAGDSDGDQD